jgi:hypothetical protein
MAPKPEDVSPELRSAFTATTNLTWPNSPQERNKARERLMELCRQHAATHKEALLRIIGHDTSPQERDAIKAQINAARNELRKLVHLADAIGVAPLSEDIDAYYS